MGKFIDLVGMKFGRLEVIKRTENDKKNNATFLCKCDCGKEVVVGSYCLKSGHTKSCNCLQKEAVKKHGNSRTRLYCTFIGMKERCYREKHKSYKNYGGRGIKICSEWLNKENGFVNFYNWAIENGYEKHLTIDRIDNNGNYEPKNCRWATYKEQNKNKRTSVKINFRGEKMTTEEISEIVGMTKEHIGRLFKKGVDLELKFKDIRRNK